MRDFQNKRLRATTIKVRKITLAKLGHFLFPTVNDGHAAETTPRYDSVTENQHKQRQFFTFFYCCLYLTVQLPKCVFLLRKTNEAHKVLLQKQRNLSDELKIYKKSIVPLEQLCNRSKLHFYTGPYA